MKRKTAQAPRPTQPFIPLYEMPKCRVNGHWQEYLFASLEIDAEGNRIAHLIPWAVVKVPAERVVLTWNDNVPRDWKEV